MENNESYYPPATAFDKEQLLRFLFYRMSQEQRAELMSELPGSYNRYCGSEVCSVGLNRLNPQIVRVTEGLGNG